MSILRLLRLVDIILLVVVLLELEDIDVVVHLICTTLPSSSNNNPAYDVQSNGVSTLRLLDGALQKRITKIISAYPRVRSE